MLQGKMVHSAEGSLTLCLLVAFWYLILFLVLFSLGSGKRDGCVLFLFRCFYLSLHSGIRSNTCLGLGQSSVYPTPQSSSGCVQVDTEFLGTQMCAPFWSGSIWESTCAGAAASLFTSPVKAGLRLPRAPPCSDLGCCPGMGKPPEHRRKMMVQNIGARTDTGGD